MDYKTYLDFVLAIENKREPAALQYLFKLLDVQQKNYLTQFDLNYFFRAIQHMMIQHGQVLIYITGGTVIRYIKGPAIRCKRGKSIWYSYNVPL